MIRNIEPIQYVVNRDHELELDYQQSNSRYLESGTEDDLWKAVDAAIKICPAIYGAAQDYAADLRGWRKRRSEWFYQI